MSSHKAQSAEPVADRASREADKASRLGLSRERIVGAALELLDREGLDALSMRRLSEQLGVGTMTLYGYFRSKDELLDAVVDSGGTRIARRVSESTGADEWKARLKELMMSLRATLDEHPGIVELRYKRPLLSPGALALTEIGIGALRDAGFSDREAGRIYRILFVYTFGFAAFGPGPGSDADRDRSAAALRATGYPALVESADEASEALADETLYERGLDALLAGLGPPP